jgi:hypothetical protein
MSDSENKCILEKTDRYDIGNGYYLTDRVSGFPEIKGETMPYCYVNTGLIAVNTEVLDLTDEPPEGASAEGYRTFYEFTVEVTAGDPLEVVYETCSEDATECPCDPL